MSQTQTQTQTQTSAAGTFAGLAVSRYGATPAQRFDGAARGSVAKPEEVAPAVERLRRVFATEKTYSYEWRVNQLQALLRLCEEGADELRKGLFLDLHKSSIESDLTEIDLVKSECHLALHKLKEWMAPHAVAVNALNMPGQAMIASDPLGVVLIMGAWNYPVQLTLAPLVGAIAGGNCAVIKPGSYAPNSSHVMAALIQKFLDPEAFVVCEGDRHVTDALLKQRFDLIFYTGSGFVGKIVAKAAAEHLTPCVLELGGKSPAIVDKSANLEVAASRLIWGSFLNGGQTCVRPDHCLVHVDVADKFLALCKSKIKEFYGEDAQKTEFYGRIINQGAFERLQALIEKSRPNIAIGGRTDPKDRFVEPTIVYYGADLAAFDAAPAMQDEIFGGILPMAAFSDLDRDVIQRIRRLPTGKPLALYLYAEDANVREQIIARTTSGGMCVNDNLMHLAVHTLHFGGVGQSGMGKYHGHESFKTFTHQKSILLKNGTLDGLPGIKETLAVRFPPYTPAKQAIIKSLANPAFEPVAEFLQSDTAKRLVLALLGALLFRKLGFRITSAL